MPRPTAIPSSAIREPLTFALGTKARLGALRVLSTLKEPVTQRELARRCRLQHRTVQLAIEELVVLGLVSRLEGGRDFLVSFNQSHHLAEHLRSLFQQEALHFTLLRREVRNAVLGDFLEAQPLALVAFGSAARAEDTPGSDLDLLVITSDVRAAEAALSNLEAYHDDIAKSFGVSIHPIAYSLRQARTMWRRRAAPLLEAYRDGIPLLGKPLPELLG